LRTKHWTEGLDQSDLTCVEITIAAGSIALLTGRAPDECLMQMINEVLNDFSPYNGRMLNGCTMDKIDRVRNAKWTNKASA
jgi:hypothetical protein